MTALLKQYGTALLSLAITLVTAIVAIPSGHLDWQNYIQIGLLGVTTLTQLWLPLLPSGWQAALKTISAVVIAVLSGLTPLILGGVYDHATIGIILLNVLQAVSGEVGVIVRTNVPTGATVPKHVAAQVASAAPGGTPVQPSGPAE